MTQTNNEIEVTQRLDTSDLLCPLPVYKAALALKQLQAGDVLEITCTDPGSLEDIPALARQRGETLLHVDNRGETQVFWLKKGAN